MAKIFVAIHLAEDETRIGDIQYQLSPSKKINLHKNWIY